MPTNKIAVKGRVCGKVQGVGFRRFVQREAEKQRVNGYAINLADGSVEVLLEGLLDAVSAVQEKTAQGPFYGRVDELQWTTVPPTGTSQFRIG